ncbi:hypothetical protein AN958_12682 [Leucoagaricus sp. SymC.cos]|nr:hypothetical protein AN958_12682 [Leucoagaricus sp. SymC.cos]
MEPTSQDAHDESSPKGFWLFKRNSQQRGGSKNAPSKRGAVRAPPLERSWSEPNSPTDPTGAGFPGRGKNEDMTDYVSQSKKLLEEYEVRFDGNPSARKLWADLNDRHKQLYTLKREPINNKLVKVNTLKPGAQDAAKSIMEELQAALEKADLLLEEFPDPETIPKGSEVDSKTQVTPQRSLTPDITSKPTSGPWFNPSSLNPAIFDKIDKHKSIHGEGTWHGHSRSRIAAPSRQIPDFTAYVNRNREVVKANELDNERDVGKGKERERNDRRDRDRVRDSDKTYGVEGDREREQEAGYSREAERSRRDRSRHRRDNIPLIEYPSRPEPTSRERQISDPAVYTRSLHRRDPSPESIAPAVYTLAEDMEVRDGVNPSAETTTGGRNMAEIGVPRVPTMLAYPGSTYEEQLAAGFGTMSPRLNHAGPSPRNDRWNPPASAPLAPVAEVPSSSGVPESETTKSHRRRRRSRDRDQDKPNDHDREREKDRPREKNKKKDRERDGKDRNRGKERDRNKDRERREHDYSNPSDRERLASPPAPAAMPTTEHSYPSTPMPGAYRDGTIPPGPIPSSGLVPPPNPPPPHTMIKFGVPTTGPYPPNPNSESRFMEILTSPAPPIHFNLPSQM